MILHTVNKSPHNSSCLGECLSLCAEGDAILLIEDGVYAAVTDTAVTGNPRIYALLADVEARGLSNRLPGHITVVDDDDFVRMATEYDKVVSW